MMLLPLQEVQVAVEQEDKVLDNMVLQVQQTKDLVVAMEFLALKGLQVEVELPQQVKMNTVFLILEMVVQD